jgi:hypothetical protein
MIAGCQHLRRLARKLKLVARLLQPIRRHGHLAAIALFVILPAVSFCELFFGAQTLWRSDITSIHYPYRILVAEEWRAGRVPLWNPYQHAGIPLLAEGQVGPLYPLNVFFLGPLPHSLELSLFIVLHYVLAALFTYFLAHVIGLNTVSATLAALSFGLGGVLMAQVGNLNVMTGIVWLPLILGMAVLVARRGHWVLAQLAGLPLALQCFTAQPQVVVYTFMILSGYMFYRFVTNGFKILRRAGSADTKISGLKSVWYAARPSLCILVMMISGLLLSAPQWLPTWELQQLSVRSQEQGLKFMTKNSWPPIMGVNLLLPSAFGNNVTGFKGGDPFGEDFIYVGFLPLVCAFLAWRGRISRDALFFWILLISALLLALGSYTPLYRWFVQYLPVLSLFRIPARWLMAVNLALAILAGYGFQSLLERGLSRRLWLICTGCFFILGLGLLFTFFAHSYILEWSRDWSGLGQRLTRRFLELGFTIQPVYQTERLLLRWLAPLTVPSVLLAFNLLNAWVLFTGYAFRILSRGTFAIWAIAAVSLDLVVAGGTTINPIRPEDWWHSLSGGARYVLEHLDEHSRVWPLGMGREIAAVRNLGQYFPSAYRVRSAGGHGSPLMLKRMDTFLDKAHPLQQVQLLGVRYILTEGRMGADVESVFDRVYQDESSVVYENRTPLPRAFIVHQAVAVPDDESALEKFADLSVNVRQTVVLEVADAELIKNGEAAPDATGEVRFILDTPQVVELYVHTRSDGYLVLLDTWYPGWEATVDGVPAPIYRANYIARAVRVPSGEHYVRFVYRPFSFWMGVVLAGLAMVSMVVSGLLSMFSRQTRYAVQQAGKDQPMCR